MTRLWIFSDLHLEQSAWDLPPDRPDFDVIVAAGDIHSPASKSVRWLAKRAEGRPVVFEPGNHEWYAPRRDFNVADERLRAMDLAAKLGVYLLMDDEITVGGVRFLGATLWTDYALVGDVEAGMRIAERSMNDHRLIFPNADMKPLRAATARQWHLASRRWLEERLPGGEGTTTVVVTHHLPHPRSIAARYIGDALNVAFCSDMSELVEGSGAALWIHGHTHASCDYQAGGTRVICNPKGYGPGVHGSRIENPDFDPRLAIEIAR